ncbi:MAG TPA: HAMP domain-containing sensor histidine kinase [Gemmatimonadaceae bacterium]|jgi:signal transduction histidine kinase
MTLRSRLVLGLVILAACLVTPLAFAIRSLERLGEDAQQLNTRELAASALIARLREGLSEVRREELALLFKPDSSQRDAMRNGLAHVRAMSDTLASYSLDNYSKGIAGSVKLLGSAADQEFAATLAARPDSADTLSARLFVPALNKADSVTRDAEHHLSERTQRSVDAQSTEIEQAQGAAVGGLALALIVAAVVAIILTRSISQPILDLRTGMAAVADGDFEYRLDVPAERKDEFGTLARSYKAMTRQLSELDKLKAEFVSVASHELKTPINVMIGYLQLLDEGVYGQLSPKQKDVHRTLVVQANTLLRLVKQLLDVSRFEAGGGRLEPRPVRVDELLEELESAFHVLAVQREIHFRVERKQGVSDEVYWDVDRMNEVLGNLLSNAFKFTPKGGEVDLVVCPVDDGVQMQVHDTGAGIPPEQLPRIFDKFYQADNQKSARSAGTGLGLAIAKQIVDAHGGSIRCDSKLGAGTTFTIKLPTRAQRRSSFQHVPAV